MSLAADPTAVALLVGGAVTGAGLAAAGSFVVSERTRILDGLRRPPPTVWPFRFRWRRTRSAGFAALAGGMLATALVGFRMLGPFGGILGILSVPSGLRWWRARGRRRATEEAEEELREICLALAAALRAGLSLRLSLEEAIRDAGPSLREPFRAVLARLSVGEPMAAALTTLLEVTDVPDVRLVASVLELHGRTGGELPGLLDEVAAALGRRIESRRQVRALTAQGRASGAVLALLPVVFVGLLTIGGGDGLGTFYRTPQGSLLLGLGLVLDGLGFLWIRRLLRTRGGA